LGEIEEQETDRDLGRSSLGDSLPGFALLAPVRFGGDPSDQPFPKIWVGIRRRFEIQNCLLDVEVEAVEL